MDIEKAQKRVIKNQIKAAKAQLEELQQTTTQQEYPKYATAEEAMLHIALLTSLLESTKKKSLWEQLFG